MTEFPADFLLEHLIDRFGQAKIVEPENKAHLFIAMLVGVALQYLANYEDYPLAAMEEQLTTAAEDICRHKQTG
jgi:hypothetical protein